MGEAARRHDHDVRRLVLDRSGLRPGVEAEANAPFLALAHAPVDDRDHLAPTRALRLKPDLAARPVGGFEDDDLVAALARDAGGFEARRAGTHDHDLLAGAGGLDRLRHRQLAPVAALWMQKAAPPW